MNAAQIPADITDLASRLGVPLYNPPLHMPGYLDGIIGQWKLSHGGFHIDRGYWSGNWGVWNMPLLQRNPNGDGKTWETWMSLSPHEIESQEFGCRCAHGHTVVMGLGMGWVAVNAALNPAVSRVTIIERDPQVLSLFEASRALDGLAPDVVGKIRVVLADALEWQPDARVDFLYADIWRTLEEPRTLDDVRRMQARVKARDIYFWGQELAIHTLCDQAQEGGAGWPQAVQQCISQAMALPLLQPLDVDYPALISQVTRQRRARWPDGIPPGV